MVRTVLDRAQCLRPIRHGNISWHGGRDYLQAQECFGATPEVWSFPVAPGDGRHAVALLIRGKGARTVLLTGHFDTVTTDDYGDLAPLAGQPELIREALLMRLAKAQDSASERARADLASGDFLPGRGLLDMKGGLAAGFAAVATIAAGPFDGNLLFLAVPDEENASAGARAAAKALPALAAQRGLTVVAAINLDAIADDRDGRAGRILATGTVGKVLPTAFVVGRPVHCGFALHGLNAAVLAGAIAARMEWAPELTDDSAGVPGTAASLLSVKDGKVGHDDVDWLTLKQVQSFHAITSLQRLAQADCPKNLGEQHAHVLVVVDQKDFQGCKRQWRRPILPRALPHRTPSRARLRLKSSSTCFQNARR